jgi:hypothetical protein
MGFDQYHEPPDELPPATRTFEGEGAGAEGGYEDGSLGIGSLRRGSR